MRCIANIPFSEGSSANARITKLENAKSSPVINPAPVMEATVMASNNVLTLTPSNSGA